MKFKWNITLTFFLLIILFPEPSKAQLSGPQPQGLEALYESEWNTLPQQSSLDSLITWKEKILLHLDRDVSAPGEPIFFKAYTLTGPNRVRATLSKVLKMELLNPENQIVATQYHKITEGMATGSFEVPRKLEEGKYTLRAYTRWLQNYGPEFYFTAPLSVGESPENRTMGAEKEAATVKFYPEGGALVAGLENRVFLKALSAKGAANDLNGQIVSATGKVFPVSNFGNGIYSAIFSPEASETYILKTTNGDTYSLPKIEPSGFLVQANNLDSRMLRIRVLGDLNQADQSLKVRGIINGFTFFEHPLPSSGSANEFEISKETFPAGMMHITLVNTQNEILSSRPVLIENTKQLNVSIEPLAVSRNPDQKAFKISVKDAAGKPVQTRLSISATNYTAATANSVENHGTGFNWNLDPLQSEQLSPDRRKRFARDLHLLTSAQRKAANIPSDQKIKYPFQQGLDLYGYAYDLNNTLLKNTKIQMLSTQGDEIILRELETDASGLLRIEGLDLSGETELVFRTEGESTQTRLVKVRPIQRQYDQKTTTEKAIIKKDQGRNEITESSPYEYLENEKLVNLDEVEVRDKKIERKRPIAPTYGLEATGLRSVVQDIERPKFIWQLLSEIPGVAVSGNPQAPSVTLASANNASFRGGRTDTPWMSSALDDPGPLWVIDGFVIGNSPGVDPSWGLTFWDIDRIELLPRAEAGIYGSRAGRGVFMIYTRNGSEFGFTNRKDGRLLFQGYHESDGFASYAEQLNKKPRKYEGRPATLFWNPDLQTDAKGEVIVEIASPITVNQLEIKASTVTESGAIGSARMVYEP